MIYNSLKSHTLLGLLTLFAACLSAVQANAQEVSTTTLESSVVAPVEATVVAESTIQESTQAPLEIFKMGDQDIKLYQEQLLAEPPIVSNDPNCIVVNLTTKPESKIGLNWYTLGNLEDAEALISTVDDFSENVKHFLADKKQV